MLWKKLIDLDIIRWCMISLPNLYQTTAFGLTGLVTIDMISKIDPSHGIDLIFLDTLHHFSETIDLLNRLSRRYPKINVHVYKPNGVSTVEEFSHKYGEKIWELDDTLYDYVAKVEPAERAYRELRAMAVLTGRRKSQGGKRGELDIIEVDDAGLVKVNPLANWSFQQVKEYIDKYKVPYNVLLDRGYKSVGDWHSTQWVLSIIYRVTGDDITIGLWRKEKMSVLVGGRDWTSPNVVFTIKDLNTRSTFDS